MDHDIRSRIHRFEGRGQEQKCPELLFPLRNDYGLFPCIETQSIFREDPGMIKLIRPRFSVRASYEEPGCGSREKDPKLWGLSRVGYWQGIVSIGFREPPTGQSKLDSQPPDTPTPKLIFLILATALSTRIGIHRATRVRVEGKGREWKLGSRVVEGNRWRGYLPFGRRLGLNTPEPKMLELRGGSRISGVLEFRISIVLGNCIKAKKGG